MCLLLPSLVPLDLPVCELFLDVLTVKIISHRETKRKPFFTTKLFHKSFEGLNRPRQLSHHQCDSCDYWFHAKCLDMSSNDYSQLSDSCISWNCSYCRPENDIPSLVNFPFPEIKLNRGLKIGHININRLTTNSMAFALCLIAFVSKSWQCPKPG